MFETLLKAVEPVNPQEFHQIVNRAAMAVAGGDVSDKAIARYLSFLGRVIESGKRRDDLAPYIVSDLRTATRLLARARTDRSLAEHVTAFAASGAVQLRTELTAEVVLHSAVTFGTLLDQAEEGERSRKTSRMKSVVRSPKPPKAPSIEESAIEDAELAARAIDYAARHARSVSGGHVARHFYETLGKGSAEWNELCSAFIASSKAGTWLGLRQQFGEEAMLNVVGEYSRAFRPRFEQRLRFLGAAQYGGPVNEFDDALAPWLQILHELVC